ncbi:MAG: hypothetical protein DMF67_10000 [Acidobacteria bacterium]|nr:MAG: hypothetical protein DMF66_15475 [Acidobacteriota bacterium]PYS83167.1 MAG: hypothetical protein DMF67_10000 [Acidobacteriota bacterium]
MTLSVFAFALLSTGGFAANGWRVYNLSSPQQADEKFKARPGVFDPDHTGAVQAQWISKVGQPDDRGNGAFALYLQKAAPTAANMAAGAIIDGVEGQPADGIYGFDYRNGGQCGAGSPRYNLLATDGFHFIGGCANGTQTPAPGAPGWTRTTFDASNPAQAFPVVTPGATIISLTLIVDEGTDLGPGYIFTDNLNILGQFITKPGAAH